MRPPDALPAAWQRLLALSGAVFAVLFLVGWFASGGDAPDYAAADQEWTAWADDNQWRSRIGAFAMLLAAFVFLHFARCSQWSPCSRSRPSGPRLGRRPQCTEGGGLRNDPAGMLLGQTDESCGSGTPDEFVCCPAGRVVYSSGNKICP
jgi:hypothetical protein